jgi:hypothetical protein
LPAVENPPLTHAGQLGLDPALPLGFVFLNPAFAVVVNVQAVVGHAVPL